MNHFKTADGRTLEIDVRGFGDHLNDPGIVVYNKDAEKEFQVIVWPHAVSFEPQGQYFTFRGDFYLHSVWRNEPIEEVSQRIAEFLDSTKSWVRTSIRYIFRN